MIELGEGDHEYKFLVDGQWITDPNAATIENNAGFKNNHGPDEATTLFQIAFEGDPGGFLLLLSQLYLQPPPGLLSPLDHSRGSCHIFPWLSFRALHS